MKTYARISRCLVALLIVFGSSCVTVASHSRATVADVRGGGCPPGSSVILTTDGGRELGSTAADDNGAFSIRVEFQETDRTHPSVNVACGPTVVAVTLTAVDGSADDTLPTWIGLLIGATMISVVVVLVLRRRWATSIEEKDDDRS